MTADIPVSDMSWLEWAFKGLVGVVFTAGWWLWTKLVSAVSKNKDDLAEYKVHVSDNYIKKDVIERVHTRLDDMADKDDLSKVSDEVSEIRSGITKILTMMAQNGRIKATD